MSLEETELPVDGVEGIEEGERADVGWGEEGVGGEGRLLRGPREGRLLLVENELMLKV